MKSSIVSEKDWQRIERFVQVFLDCRGSVPAPGAPPDMIAGPNDESGWVPWRPVDSPVTEEDIARLEQQAGAAFPPLFRAYLMYKCLMMTDFYPVSLPMTPSNAPLEEVEELLALMRDDPFFERNGYVPFGQDSTNATGPVCFDTRCPSAQQDYPVILVDRQLMRKPGYTGRREWESFAALLDDIEARMLTFYKKRSNVES